MNLKNLIVIKWDSLAVSIISIIYGIQLIKAPEVVDTFKSYELLSQIFTSKVFGTIFILLSLGKLIGLFLNLPRLRALSISGLVSIWTLFLVAILLSFTTNTVWILALAMVVFSFGVVAREWFH